MSSFKLPVDGASKFWYDIVGGLLHHSVYEHHGWFFAAKGGSFVVKVDVNLHRISADENIQSSETSIQIDKTKAVCTKSTIFRVELTAHK